MSIRKLGVSFEGAQKTDQAQKQADQDKSVQQQKEAQERIFNEQRENLQKQNDQKLLEQRSFLQKQRAEKKRLNQLNQQKSRGNTDMVTTPAGVTSPIPQGSVGPHPTRAPGMQYNDGNGGHGFKSTVADVRIMSDNSSSTSNKNHRERTIYYDKTGRPVDPYTGQSHDKSKTHQFHDKKRGV